MPKRQPPELKLQEHIANFLVREHRYGMLEQSDITDTENFIAHDQLWTFLQDTQGEAIEKLAAEYQTKNIFRHPFLYLAADTSEVMAATDPCRAENFRCHNTGVTNTPINKGEYPVEFLYREILSEESLLEALSFFLVYVPKREADKDRPERAAFTLGSTPEPSGGHLPKNIPLSFVLFSLIISPLDCPRAKETRCLPCLLLENRI